MAEDSGQRTARVVDEFLTFIRAQPDGRNLMELSNKFERMVNPERTDLTYLSSPDFRNVLRLALVRSRRQPSKVATHVRDVIDHMKLNAPKTPEQRGRLLELRRLRIQNSRLSARTPGQMNAELKAVMREIRSLENTVMSTDDLDHDTRCTRMDGLKRRAIRLFEAIEERKGNRIAALSEWGYSIIVQSSQLPEINRALTLLVREQRKRHTVPDFSDVLKEVRKASEQSNIGITRDRQRTEALMIFDEIMTQVKQRRKTHTKRNMESLEVEMAAPDDFDPTAEDENLRRKLEQQVAEGNQKIDLVLQEYVEIQADGRQGRHDTPGDLEQPDDESIHSDVGNDSCGEEDSSETSERNGRPSEGSSSSDEEMDLTEPVQILQNALQNQSGQSRPVADHPIEPLRGSVRESVRPEPVGAAPCAKVQTPSNQGLHGVIEIGSSEDESEKPEQTPEPRRVIPMRINAPTVYPREIIDISD